MALTNTESVQAYMGRKGINHGGELTKPDILAAILAMWGEIAGVGATVNAALPQPYKSTATTDQKIDLFILVLRRYRNDLRIKEDV